MQYKMTRVQKENSKAVMKTVALPNILTERCAKAESASVKRIVKITSESNTLREMG